MKKLKKSHVYFLIWSLYCLVSGIIQQQIEALYVWIVTTAVFLLAVLLKKHMPRSKSSRPTTEIVKKHQGNHKNDFLRNKEEQVILKQQPAVQIDSLENTMRIINDSTYLIENSKNLETVLSRYKILEEAIYRLREIEHEYNLAIKSDDYFNYYIVRKSEIINHFIDLNFELCKMGALELKTPKGRENRLNKFFENFDNKKLGNENKMHLQHIKELGINYTPKILNTDKLIINNSTNYLTNISPKKTYYRIMTLDEIIFTKALYDKMNKLNLSPLYVEAKGNGLSFKFKNYEIGWLCLNGNTTQIQTLSIDDVFMDEIYSGAQAIEHIDDWIKYSLGIANIFKD